MGSTQYTSQAELPRSRCSLCVLHADSSHVLLPKTLLPPALATQSRLDIFWNTRDTSGGALSLPAAVDAHLLGLREVCARWAYETGRFRVQGKELQECLQAGAPLSLWWCSLLYERHPIMLPALHSICKLRMLEKLLEEHDCTTLVLYGGNKKLRRTLEEYCSLTQKTFYAIPENPALTKTASAQKNGFFSFLSSSTEEEASPASLMRLKTDRRPVYLRWLLGLFRALPTPLRATTRLAHWWLTVRRHLPHTRDICANLPGAATVVTHFPSHDSTAAASGEFRSRYWEGLHDMFRQEHGSASPLHWLFIRITSPSTSLKQCLALRERFRDDSANGASFHYIEEFLTFSHIVRAIRRFFKLCWRSWRMESAVRPAFFLPHSRMPLWHFLKEGWKESFQGWRCLERCLQDEALRAWSRWTAPQAWVLFPLENCPWERMLAHAVHTEHIGPLYGAQHSSIREGDFRYIDDPRTFETPDCRIFQPDILCPDGQHAHTQWIHSHVPPQYLYPVEALRYQHLLFPASTCDASPPPPPDEGLFLPSEEERAHLASHKIAAFQHRPILPITHLLLVTGFTDTEVRRQFELLTEAEASGLLAQRIIILKPHPWHNTEKFLKALPISLQQRLRVSREPLPKLFAPHTLVWAASSTTASVEAIYAGLPVLVDMPDDDFDLCPLKGCAGLTRCQTASDITHALLNPHRILLSPDWFLLDPALPRWRALLFGTRMRDKG